MPRIVVAGAGAIGASIAYHLVHQGADDVVLVDRSEIASGSTARAMGGVRQQFSTAPEVRLAQESIRFFEDLGPGFFQQVGYLFLATTEDGLHTLETRQALQQGLGVLVERLAPDEVARLAPGVARTTSSRGSSAARMAWPIRRASPARSSTGRQPRAWTFASAPLPMRSTLTSS